jgi:N-dimethylarginine dimethylaminohydrolase
MIQMRISSGLPIGKINLHEPDFNSYLMCPPKAFHDWLTLYKFMAARSLVYLLPAEGQSFTANLGIVLPHIPTPTVVLSNFTSPTRGGGQFFRQMEYTVRKCPHRFEGEADLKHIRENIYAFGYGIRTDIETSNWMIKQYDMKIYRFHMTDPKLCHFDTVCFPLTSRKILLTTSALSRNQVDALSDVADIIDVPKKFAQSSLTNCVRLDDTILCRNLPLEERQWLSNICHACGLDLQTFPLGGADLSCMIMTLKRAA